MPARCPTCLCSVPHAASGDTMANLLPGYSAPTSLADTNYTLAAGKYDLYCSEVDGAPAVLDAEGVPEPASMALAGAGLLGLGYRPPSQQPWLKRYLAKCADLAGKRSGLDVATRTVSTPATKQPGLRLTPGQHSGLLTHGRHAPETRRHPAHRSRARRPPRTGSRRTPGQPAPPQGAGPRPRPAPQAGRIRVTIAARPELG